MKTDYRLLDEHMKSLDEMKMADTDDFFYTRLKERMAGRRNRVSSLSNWKFPLRPAWVIGMLVVLLGLNATMLSHQLSHRNTTATKPDLRQFAAAYDQTINASY